MKHATQEMRRTKGETKYPKEYDNYRRKPSTPMTRHVCDQCGATTNSPENFKRVFYCNGERRSQDSALQ